MDAAEALPKTGVSRMHKEYSEASNLKVVAITVAVGVAAIVAVALALILA